MTRACPPLVLPLSFIRSVLVPLLPLRFAYTVSKSGFIREKACFCRSERARTPLKTGNIGKPFHRGCAARWASGLGLLIFDPLGRPPPPLPYWHRGRITPAQKKAPLSGLNVRVSPSSRLFHHARISFVPRSSSPLAPLACSSLACHSLKPSATLTASSNDSQQACNVGRSHAPPSRRRTK